MPNPEQVLAEMVQLTRPGGWVASLEPDCEHSIYYPHHRVFDRLHELFMVPFSRNGADPLIGRRLGELYRQTGLEDVGVDIRAAAHPAGHSRRTIVADLVRAMRPQILALGASDERELDELDATARQHLANPEVVAMLEFPRFCGVLSTCGASVCSKDGLECRSRSRRIRSSSGVRRSSWSVRVVRSRMSPRRWGCLGSRCVTGCARSSSIAGSATTG